MRMTNADSALNGAGPKHHFTQHATLAKPCLCQASHIMLAICLAPAVAIHAGSASPSGARGRNAQGFSPCGFDHLCFPLRIGATDRSLNQSHAPYTPAAICPVIRLPTDLSRDLH